MPDGRRHLPMYAVKANVLWGLLTQPAFWVNVEQTGLRNAIEITPHLSDQKPEKRRRYSHSSTPFLLNETPSTRAAVLHLAALKQAATSVASFF